MKKNLNGNYNPGQNSWNTNAIAHQSVAPFATPPPPIKFCFNTTNTAWQRGGQHKYGRLL